MRDDDLSDGEVEAIGSELVRDSTESEDPGPVREIDGECIVCSEEAVWQSPSGTYCCGEHAREHFRERRG